MSKLTVGLIVKNEEKLLPTCLRSVQPIADEILVVDTGSVDRTPTIARRFGARVLRHRWQNNFSRARNVYVREAGGDWILSIDADEVLAKKDLRWIASATHDPRAAAFRLERRTYLSEIGLFFGWRPCAGEYPIEENRSGLPGYSAARQVRLFRKDPRFLFNESAAVHEDLSGPVCAAGGRIHDCRAVIHDFGFSKGAGRFRRKQNFYARLASAGSRRSLSANALMNLALHEAFAERSPFKAIRRLESAHRKDPKAPHIDYLAAVLCCRTGNLEKALSFLGRALRTDRRHADSLWLKGVCLDETGRPREARAFIEEAVRRVPKHPAYLNSLGVLDAKLEKTALARKRFREARAILPGWPEPKKNLDALVG